MNKRVYFLFYIISLIIAGCTDSKESEAKAETTLVSVIPKVKIRKVKETSFHTEITSNGKLEAVRKVDLTFENNGVIRQVLVHDGDQLQKGQLIAYQDADYLQTEKAKNKEALIKARLQIEDVLLGFGYSLKDSLNIPKETMNMATSRSGISAIYNQISQTQKKYTASRITAPFSGVIANMTAKENGLSSAYDKVCTLIDNTELLVSFYILEKEYGLISKGDTVAVSSVALPDKKFAGTIKYINPVIDENGLILVKASVKNTDKSLIDGMNVTVSIQHTINNIISIPKKAIVERQERKVVFTYKAGKSVWNYVIPGNENRDSIIVKEGLQIGELIITEGHINLAHDTTVELIE